MIVRGALGACASSALAMRFALPMKRLTRLRSSRERIARGSSAGRWSSHSGSRRRGKLMLVPYFRPSSLLAAALLHELGTLACSGLRAARHGVADDGEVVMPGP